MMREKLRNFKEHPAICLEDLVPEDNFYREVEAKLDLTFVRDLVKNCYSSHMGRPSIDPVVFFKIQLIMFFEGIRSERQLMEHINVNLAYRWYIGYDLDEKVPDHSSLTKIRDRYGLEVFISFFEQIVELCVEAGLVWGKELYLDGTKIEANAALDNMVLRWYWEAKQHTLALFEQEQQENQTDEDVPEPAPPQKSIHHRLIEKYDGTRLTGRRAATYNRITDTRISPTDPDAAPMKYSKLGYHTHYVVDGGKARIILAPLITPASIMDNTPMLDLERWVRFRWKLEPKIVVGDTKYGTLPNIVGLEQDGILAYMPVADLSKGKDFYPRERFDYYAEHDVFVCPQGMEIPLYKTSYTEEEWVYRADSQACDACPVKPQCTKSKSGRYLRRSFFQDTLDRAAEHRETEAYKKAMRKRQVWVEPLFGEGKQWHGMARFRLRGLAKVNIEGTHDCCWAEHQASAQGAIP